MTESLFSVALSQARRKITLWPLPSYSQNGRQDSECRAPTSFIIFMTFHNEEVDYNLWYELFTPFTTP